MGQAFLNACVHVKQKINSTWPNIEKTELVIFQYLRKVFLDEIKIKLGGKTL